MILKKKKNNNNQGVFLELLVTAKKTSEELKKACLGIAKVNIAGGGTPNFS